MSDDFVKVVRRGNYATVVVYDRYPEDPREWSNLGKFFLRTRSVSLCECEENELDKAAVSLPVYKYEHSGICLGTDNSCYPFSDPWDSCLAGYIVAFADDIRKEYGIKRITAKIRKTVEEVLNAEVDIYSKCLNGEVYGFENYKVDESVDDEDIEEEGELLDSRCGFYSIDDALEEGQAELPEMEEAAVTA